MEGYAKFCADYGVQMDESGLPENTQHELIEIPKEIFEYILARKEEWLKKS